METTNEPVIRPTPAAKQTRPTRGELITWAALFALMLLMFSGVFLSRFDRDESQWIYTARYLTLFRQGDFLSPEWDTYWTETQSPLARYVMGISLKAAGFDLFQLNSPWDFTKEDSENSALGNMPTPEMLFQARLPMGIIASVAVLLIYLIGNNIASGFAGICAAAWLALNPRSRELMTHAEADGLLVALMLLGLWLAIKLISQCEKSQQPGAKWLRPLLLTLLLGLVLGLAGSAKLTGAVGLAALGVSLPAYSLVRWLRQRHDPRRWEMLGRRLVAVTATIVGTASIATLLFVLLNPAFYDDPAANSLALFNHRQTEMQEQMAAYPSAALAEGLPRIQTAVERTLFTYSVTAGLLEGVGGKQGAVIGEMLPLDAVLVIVGLASAVVVMAARLGWKPSKILLPSEAQTRFSAGAAGIALVYTAVHFFAIAPNMGLDWDRYTLPLSIFAALWAGIGLRYFGFWILDFGLKTQSKIQNPKSKII